MSERVDRTDYEIRLARAWKNVDYPTAPVCPKHKIHLKQKMAKQGDRPFWGCPEWPNCNYTHPARNTRRCVTLVGGLCSGK